ncbi:hypothetical protein [Dyella tabacisoli]|uniref:Uncharacterized protein n=1 Tax=Dyella tabacisoli TaxID=2282381 RepID=A0A369UIC9_9GAMM|nr:hypothetical protein [Dyella tabacisoli]RDD80321.1 hypothetical protein DVJ77_17885 [Dyella tabacisoli]
MHFEVPKTKLHSFKEFTKHYLMIVLSILTALGLEQWIERTHHDHAAAFAGQQIEAELRANLVSVQTSLQNNAEHLKPLQQMNETLTQDIKNGVSNITINQHIQAAKDQFRLSLDWPTLASQAWDVAVANQSATWLNVADLRTYATAYAAQRDAAAWMTHDSTLFLNAPRMATLRTELNLGVNVEPVEFVAVLQQMIGTASQTQSHLQQMEAQLAHALHVETERAKS